MNTIQWPLEEPVRAQKRTCHDGGKLNPQALRKSTMKRFPPIRIQMLHGSEILLLLYLRVRRTFGWPRVQVT